MPQSVKQKKAKIRERQKTGEFHEGQNRTVSVYADFRRWKKPESPRWHPVKKMRYVFYRMICGRTVTDALAEIHWSPSEFWHFIDLKKDTPFRDEYMRAKKLQGRAIADSIVTIAEGRDSVTKRGNQQIVKLIKSELRRTKKFKSRSAMRAIITHLTANVDVNDLRALTRAKIQIEAAKWIAKAVNPAEFGDKSTVAVGQPDGEGNATAKPLMVQFVGPDGKAVKL